MPPLSGDLRDHVLRLLRWMQLVFHVKCSTSIGADDGIIQMWRRWSDESSFTKIHELLTARLDIPSRPGILNKTAEVFDVL